MLEAIHYLRKGILAKLTGAITWKSQTVQAYNRVPSNASYPYIIVYSVATNEIDLNKSALHIECITRIEVVDRAISDDGGQLGVNSIMNQVLQLLRTRSNGYVDLTADGFNVYTSVSEGVTYLQDDTADHTYYRAILELSNRIQPV